MQNEFVIQNSKILVTGGAGFIGSYLAAELAEAGYGPIAICDEFGARSTG